jgi:hypothetical protein
MQLLLKQVKRTNEKSTIDEKVLQLRLQLVYEFFGTLNHEFKVCQVSQRA